jgi:RNA polymerase primary sigma factor
MILAPEKLSLKVAFRTRRAPDPSSHPGDGPSGVDALALYFREMAALPVQRQDDEFVAGHRMQTLDLQLWQQVIGYRPLFRPIMAAAQQALAETVGVELAEQLLGPLSRDRQQRKRPVLARKLRDLDEDRQLLLAAMRTIDDAAAAPARRRSREFARYRRMVRSLYTASQTVRDEFVRSNLRLVVSIARRFQTCGVPLSDLIQEGNIGLIKAVGRYDYRRGYRFSTYACWWIRHTIGRALADKERSVRLPVHLLETHRKIQWGESSLTQALGRPPTAAELGSWAGVEPDAVERALSCSFQPTLSLDQALSDEDGRQLRDMLPDPKSLLPVEKIIDRSIQRQVSKTLQSLRPIEQEVLRKRFGLSGTPEQTLQQVGEQYQLSRERIRQIQEQALAKLRRHLEKSKAV